MLITGITMKGIDDGQEKERGTTASFASGQQVTEQTRDMNA